MAVNLPISVTIADNAAVTGDIDITTLAAKGYRNYTLSILMASGTWVSAGLYVDVSLDGTNFYPLVASDSSYYGIAAFASGLVHTVTDIPINATHIRLASRNSSTKAAVNQTNGPLTIQVVFTESV